MSDYEPEAELLRAFFPRTGAVLAYMNALQERGRRNQAQMLRTAVEESGTQIEDLLRRCTDDEGLAVLLALALEAAARVAGEQAVRALGRVTASALTDDALIDDAQLIAATLRDLAPPHVRALGVLITADAERKEPGAFERTVRLRIPPAPGSASGVGRVLAARLRCGPDVAEALTATLERHGLVWNDPPGFPGWGITPYGRTVYAYLAER